MWGASHLKLNTIVLLILISCSLGYKMAANSAPTWFFFYFWQYFFQKSVVLEANRLEPRTGPTSVGPDLGSNLSTTVQNTNKSVSRLKWVYNNIQHTYVCENDDIMKRNHRYSEHNYPRFFANHNEPLALLKLLFERRVIHALSCVWKLITIMGARGIGSRQNRILNINLFDDKLRGRLS